MRQLWDLCTLAVLFLMLSPETADLQAECRAASMHSGQEIDAVKGSLGNNIGQPEGGVGWQQGPVINRE